jgi:hypothetical protein
MAGYTARKPIFEIKGSAPFRRDGGPRYPSLDLSNVPIPANDPALRLRQYDSKMLERERVAQAEIAYKRTCVAPLHKSSYVYVTPGMSPGSFRKNEVL